MKKFIRLTESDLVRIVKKVIIESNDTDDRLVYITKNENKLTKEVTAKIGKYQNPFSYIIVPPKTKFKLDTYRPQNGLPQYAIIAWNGKLRYNCNEYFYDSEGYKYKSTYLDQSLKNKFCDSLRIKQSLIDIHYDNNLKKKNEKNQDKNCINKITKPYNNAVTWWKNKLNEPAFYNKLKKLNNYTDSQTKNWITKYKNYIDNSVYGPYCLTKGKDNFLKKNPNTIAYAQSLGSAHEIFYNISNTNEPISDIEATFVHEIQHALYDLKPMTPDKNWKQVFPYKAWAYDSISNQNVNPNEKSIRTNYNISQSIIDWWKNELKSKTKEKRNYTCRITELSSRVVTMKNLLNKKTTDKITVNEFKTFLNTDKPPYNDENAYWICLCWVYNGMPDIKTFLDNLDKYIVAKVGGNKQDDIT